MNANEPDRDLAVFQAVEALLACRDACGNEREALRDWEAENGQLSADERALAWQGLAWAWEASQREAGVISLTWRKRAQAEKDLNA